MGCVLGTAGCVACCCGSAACSLCCSACPSAKNSTSSRIGYALMLLFTTIVSCIMLAPKVGEQLEKISWFCDKAGVNCQDVVGYIAVYRVAFGIVMFFAVLAILMLGVKSSRDPRSGIQNGFWGIKFLVLIGAIVGAFFIPNTSGKFADAWMYVGLVGSFLFIIHQLILLVDFAHSWSSNWIDNMEESGSKCWMAALLVFTVVMYGGAIACIVCMYVYFTQSDVDGESCHLEKSVISIELIMCIVISVIAILPAVQERQPKSGLLQAGCISLYSSYLTWSALSYEGSKCNDFLKGTNSPSVDAQSIIGIVLTFVLVIFACVRTTSSSTIGKIGLGDGENSENSSLNTGGESGEKKGQHVYDDEQEGLTYHYTFFHITMMFGALYLMMTVTNWYKPTSDVTMLSSSTAAFWVKISSSWVCLALYIWTLVAPVLLPDREFGN